MRLLEYKKKKKEEQVTYLLYFPISIFHLWPYIIRFVSHLYYTILLFTFATPSHLSLLTPILFAFSFERIVNDRIRLFIYLLFSNYSAPISINQRRIRRNELHALRRKCAIYPCARAISMHAPRPTYVLQARGKKVLGTRQL